MVPNASSPPFGAQPRAGYLIEQPGQLVAEKYGSSSSPERAAISGSSPAARICLTGGGGAPILPDDGARHRFAALAIPQYRGLTLIGDADGGDVARAEPGRAQRLDHGGTLRFKDFVGVVLHPSGLRKVLRELLL